MGIPVLHLETRLSDKDMKALSDYAAALSTRKTYGYGIVDKDGQIARIKRGALMSGKEDELAEIVDMWNQIAAIGVPYRVVPLFYEEQS